MLGVVADGLKGGHGRGFLPRLVPGVGVSVEPGEVAAGDLQTDLVPFQEDIAGRYQVYRVLVNLLRLDG